MYGGITVLIVTCGHGRQYHSPGRASTRRRRVPVGSAVLDTNPEHNHWHFADFLSYTLRRVRSTTVRRSKKQSFCLEDVAKLRKTARRRLFRECPDPEADTGEMGITPGGGDVYWAGVQEQYIEVKGLPTGDYWLEMVVDPKKRLREVPPLSQNESEDHSRVGS